MKFHLITHHPVALDSPDHIEPRSTVRDNSSNPAFNKKLRALYEGKSLTVLDLGCAGGGMVRTLIEEGVTAVGLEGSDYNLVNKRAEWATIPESLFTCDVAKPFTLSVEDSTPYKFDVITAWEFFEHIAEADMPSLFMNIHRHLKVGGLVIASISDQPSVWDVIDHHQTQKPLIWWLELFDIHGFALREDLERYFKGCWVRSVRFNVVFEKRAL